MEDQSLSSMKENKDYEIIASDEDADAWNIRILTVDFVETVIKFGAISFNDPKDHLNFNFTIVSSPDIITESNINLQGVCADILEDILENGVKEGSLGLKDRNTGEMIEYKN